MTELLFYDDPKSTEFDATVIAKSPSNDAWDVVLDRTCFYPEGGGQPADRGTIGGLPVLDVRKSDGVVHHVVSIEPAENVGDAVHGIVDWNRRLDYMQQHTGQHILSAALVGVGDYPTVSVHQGEEYTTIEVGAPDITDADLTAAEDAANAVIRRDLPVRSHWVTDERLSEYPLRRPAKVSGDIRLVEIAETDWVACGGVHTERTAEVGLVKVVGRETIRGNVRLYCKIGGRAYADYRLKDLAVASLVTLLSAKPHEIAGKVEGLIAQLADAEYRNRRLEESMAEYEADRLLREFGGSTVITAKYEGRGKGFLLDVMKRLSGAGNPFACLVNAADGRIFWCVGAGEDTGFDFGRFKADILPIIEGKGGGKPPVWQGAGNDPGGADPFLHAFTEAFAR